MKAWAYLRVLAHCLFKWHTVYDWQDYRGAVREFGCETCGRPFWRRVSTPVRDEAPDV